MWLKNLTLLNFKNYTQAEISLHNNVNVFLGNNGAGKTNLLDAVHYLCLCKSFFNPIDSQQIKTGADFFMVQGQFIKNDVTDTISCGVKRNTKKQFRRNKKDYEKLSDHIGQYPLVMISPNDTSLITEGSEERRKFIDNVISQTNHMYLESLITYNKALLNRNALLKNTPAQQMPDELLLGIYNQALAPQARLIHNARSSFMEAFLPLFQHYYTSLSHNSEQVGLEYRSQLNKGADMLTLLQQSLGKDRILQRTTAGIHKDDLIFSLEEMPLKRFGSQGQQKTYLIALKLAQYSYLKQHTGVMPVLLLDDIFDKLDSTRISRLLGMVSTEDFGQIFITDTGKERIENIFKDYPGAVSLFNVENGTISHA